MQTNSQASPPDKLEQGGFTFESHHYAKQADGFVYYYWRVVGLDQWNVQKTALKEVPYTTTN